MKPSLFIHLCWRNNFFIDITRLLKIKIEFNYSFLEKRSLIADKQKQVKFFLI